MSAAVISTTMTSAASPPLIPFFKFGCMKFAALHALGAFGNKNGFGTLQ
jgi:hypothetical protein